MPIDHSLKCFLGSCSSGDDAVAVAPFCGNALSAAEPPMGNNVAIGVCGKCQVNVNGGGGDSSCETGQTDRLNCPMNTSCPSSTVCCFSGQCASEPAPPGDPGANCP